MAALESHRNPGHLEIESKRCMLFGFVSVKVRVLVPPAAIDDGLNTLPMVGFATTVRVAEAGSGLENPPAVVRSPLAIVFV